jgi:bifunctional UDP-N-acetylglucosamine pyrophosphorylase/glucosamine-1-phosphate N-acetyltransferase
VSSNPATTAEGGIGAVVVLAAGQGTRMRSTTPKVLHRLGGRSMLGHVLAAAAPLRAARTVVVVGSDTLPPSRWTPWARCGGRC